MPLHYSSNGVGIKTIFKYVTQPDLSGVPLNTQNSAKYIPYLSATCVDGPSTGQEVADRAVVVDRHGNLGERLVATVRTEQLLYVGCDSGVPRHVLLPALERLHITFGFLIKIFNCMTIT